MASAACIPVRIPAPLLERLDAYAAQLDVSRNTAIKLCLSNHFGLITSLNPAELMQFDGRVTRHAKAAKGKRAAGGRGTAKK